MVAFQEVKHRNTISSSDFNFSCIFKRTQRRGLQQIYVNLCYYMHMNNTSIIHKSPRRETAHNRWINKIWHICTMEYRLVLRRKEILLNATWIEPFLSEISQSQEDKYYMISLIRRCLEESTQR